MINLIRFCRPHQFVRWMFPEALFRLDTNDKVACLSFDDGPDPQSTPLILETLAEFGIKALFFCSGRNVQNNPELLERIISEGHVTGNHGFNHYDGWKTRLNEYLDDIDKASGLIPGEYLRPPYGRLTSRQYLRLKKKYMIVFWDILPYDFDAGLNWERSFGLLKKKLRPGSLIALHDKPGSSSLKYLRLFIEDSLARGYRFVLPGQAGS